MGYTGFMASSISWRVSVVAKSPVDWFSVKGHWPGHKCGFTNDRLGFWGCLGMGCWRGGDDMTIERSSSLFVAQFSWV